MGAAAAEDPVMYVSRFVTLMNNTAKTNLARRKRFVPFFSRSPEMKEERMKGDRKGKDWRKEISSEGKTFLL